jgi:hypothetical protein
MNSFHYVNNALYCEDVPVAELAAKYGTPLSRRVGTAHHLLFINLHKKCVEMVGDTHDETHA